MISVKAVTSEVSLFNASQTSPLELVKLILTRSKPSVAFCESAIVSKLNYQRQPSVLKSWMQRWRTESSPLRSVWAMPEMFRPWVLCSRHPTIDFNSRHDKISWNLARQMKIGRMSVTTRSMRVLSTSWRADKTSGRVLTSFVRAGKLCSSLLRILETLMERREESWRRSRLSFSAAKQNRKTASVIVDGIGLGIRLIASKVKVSKIWS